MTQLTQDDVRKIAHLARLQISEAEIESLTQDMDNILAMVAKMKQADVERILPMSHPSDATQPLRPDVVTETNQRDLLLKNAPQSYMGLFIVPQVIETDE